MVYGVNKTGTTAAKFLSIEVGSNAVGMGGAYTSIANDATAMYWNPAGLSFHDTKEVYFNHANWIADISFDYFGITFPMNNKSVLGFNLIPISTFLFLDLAILSISFISLIDSALINKIFRSIA